MPNWCENTLTVRGNKKKLDEFKKAVKGKDTELSLAKIVPEPDYSKVRVKPFFPIPLSGFKTDEDGYVKQESAWWDWRLANWGTKWDVEVFVEHTTNEEIIYRFSSAWSPPDEAIKRASEKFPELVFRLDYEEGGMGFKGTLEVSDGEILVDESSNP